MTSSSANSADAQPGGQGQLQPDSPPERHAPHRFNLKDQAARDWNERAQTCIDMLRGLVEADPGLRSVADIGCGDAKLGRMLHEQHVPLRYAGYDLMPQGEAVQRFDLASDVLSTPADIVVLLGVMEYVSDFEAALRRLAPVCRHLVLSHVLRSARSPSPQRLAELGWTNHFDEDQLKQAVRAAGFECCSERLTPDRRTLMLCCRPTTSPP